MEEKLFKVYFVEDNPTETMLMRLALQQIKNVEVIFFQNGTDLLKKFSESPSDVVVADLMLPDFHGQELIFQLKKIEKKVKIIVISAQEDVEVIAELQNQDIFNYIVKSDGCLKYLQKTIQVACFLIRNEYDFG
ncbi:response regulator [Flammeovirga sp. SJP92]|uniref:response regulator n=1 Tax=Flammeovirga sp. SJP92 TaxID=1775430 RepID=UPI0007896BB4|nr:response regulator [Flammeovirga sp. SJP92]KXX68094.1 hypothetical protein AVL50_23575 [Flammeovirga sp. SJP92]